MTAHRAAAATSRTPRACIRSGYPPRRRPLLGEMEVHDAAALLRKRANQADAALRLAQEHHEPAAPCARYFRGPGAVRECDLLHAVDQWIGDPVRHALLR